MKKFWVEVIPWDKNLITLSLESGADAVLVEKGYSAKVKELGLITTIAEDGDLKPGNDVEKIRINNSNDVNKIASLAKNRTVIVQTTDWTIIPIENLVAQAENIVMQISNANEAQLALQILEKGVDGVLLKTNDPNEIKKTSKLIKEQLNDVAVVKAKIESVTPVGMGDRVCIDTITNMSVGEGMLVGNSSSGMFLVHSESEENPYVEPRPFRVNAGAVHAYVLTPDSKTRYLSELKSGDKLLVVNTKGNSRISYVGRVKVEKRPMMLITAKHENMEISLVLQNAETIKLIASNGTPVSVVALKKGDEVLAYVEKAGRHFGMKIEETITEK